jgi:nitrous oxidase accessory protein
VSPGTYKQSLAINKSVTLRSAGGADATILDGDSAGENYYMVSISADNVTLDGFTITNPLYSGRLMPRAW